MIYQGSKARLRKFILPILQKCIDDNKVDTYIEPFVGGANIIDHIACHKRIGSDNNQELIALLKYIQSDNSISIAPDDCTFEHYKDVRENRKLNTNKYSVEYTALIGWFASYGGRYFDGGYGRDNRGERCIYRERLENAKEQAAFLKDIDFSCADFEEYKDVKGCVFYLDPPYKDTKMYNGKNFDSERFYDFARHISKNNYVFISEYDMPQDFEIVWSKERKVLQKSNRTVADVATEKLFKYKWE